MYDFKKMQEDLLKASEIKDGKAMNNQVEGISVLGQNNDKTSADIQTYEQAKTLVEEKGEGVNGDQIMKGIGVLSKILGDSQPQASSKNYNFRNTLEKPQNVMSPIQSQQFINPMKSYKPVALEDGGIVQDENSVDLQTLRDNIQTMRERINQPEQESTWKDHLPDALAGLHNIVNYSQGSQQKNLDMNHLNNLQKSRKSKKSEDIDNIQKLQQMYNQYMDRNKSNEITPYQQAQLDLSRDKMNQDKELKTASLNAKKKEKASKVKLSEGQKAIDKEFGKAYAKQIASGTEKQSEADLMSLQKVLKKMQDSKDMFEGPLDKAVEYLGGFSGLRSMVNPELQDTKDRLEQIIQQDLRKTLGAQFTEKEGKQFLERSFNPKLGQGKNVERLQDFIQKVKNRNQQMQDSARYFEEKGTLEGYEPLEFKSEEKSEVNEVRRKTKDGRTAIFNADTKGFIRYE